MGQVHGNIESEQHFKCSLALEKWLLKARYVTELQEWKQNCVPPEFTGEAAVYPTVDLSMIKC